MKNKALFLSLEGSEGAGKSTSLKFIQQWFETNGIELLVTREPGGTPFAEEIRALLLANREEKVVSDAELLLMYASRAQLCQSFIIPHLENGQYVISDRFNDASFAYQGFGRGLDIGRLTELDRWVLGDFKPDLTLFLDISVELGLKRAGDRSTPDRFEVEDISFFNNVRKGYLERAKNEPDRIKIIDASGSIEQVQARIAAVLEAVINAN
ncbi:MAG: dTMP kinase [Enterobacterales bacterium]